MAWFQLDPESIAQRVQGDRNPQPFPSVAGALLRGALGFCLVSIAGFVPWAIFGQPLHRLAGEAGMYAACAAVFVALSGLVLHPLILGPGSLGRFYRLFAVAFSAYSVAWILGWMLFRGHTGSLVGLLAGTVIMGWILTRAFDAPTALLPVVLALFIGNAAGYFIGGWVEGALAGFRGPDVFGIPLSKTFRMRTAMLSWGVFYGLGFGAGLGFAFHRCQRQVHERLRPATPPRP